MNKVELKKLDELEYKVNEAYKTLRTNLSFCGDDIKTILLTSCTPNEGKTTVSFRLSQALADDKKKVMLIDADLRKSVLISRYGVAGEKKIEGLSHYLSGQSKLEDIMCETNVDNLDVIFAGPLVPNPTELLGNSYFADMIEKLKEVYDYIIIDAPPLGSVIDAAVLTKVCDSSIFVIENDVVSYRFAQSVKKQLELTGCKIIGVILNKYDMYGRGKYRGYYSGYYKKKNYKSYAPYGEYSSDK